MVVNLEAKLGKMNLKNPVMVASGTFGYGKEYADYIDINKLGAIITKSITLKPKVGNRPPRIVEVTSGILNSIGLENVGLEKFIEQKLPYLKDISASLIVSIAGYHLKDYAKLALRLNEFEYIDALEINISCPNVESKNRLSFSQDKKLAFKLVKSVRRATDKTLIVKLSPNVTDINEIASSVEAAGADALALINTVGGMAIDIDKKMPKIGNIIGGLSGPAIKPLAVKAVYQVSRRVSIPIIGQGGIMCSEDAMEFLMAGAAAVSIGTANFIDPQTPINVIEGIKKYMERENITDVANLVGSLKEQIVI